MFRAHPDPTATGATGAAPPALRRLPAGPPEQLGRAPRSWGRRSVVLSVGAHLLLVVLVLGLYRVSLGRPGEAAQVATLRVERSMNADVIPEERPEPERAPEVPVYESEPELVEAIITPEPWPEDEGPADVPLQDPLAGVPAFKRPPVSAPVAVATIEPPEVAPFAEVEVVEAATPVEPPPPVASAPRVLTGDDLPAVIEGPLPRYPRQALRMNWQGTVRLRIRIDARGEVLGVEVSESSGHGVLDDAAVEAFERWVFAAKHENDPDVRVLGKPFTFRIR